MSAGHKHLRECRDMALEAGFEIDSVEMGKHIKVYVRSPLGERTLLVFPTSPSDYRWRVQKRAELARIARGGKR